jgi:AcrR family transcriptional regulator
MYDYDNMTIKQSKDVRIGSIVNAAVEEFLEKGYDSTSMDAIASRAGISKGGLYHHFRNKDEVLSFANKVFTLPVYEMMAKLVQNTDKPGGLAKFIDEYITYWEQHRKELQFFFLSMNKCFGDELLLQEYREYFRQELDLITNVYTDGQKAGQFIPINSRSLALSLISALDGSLAYLLIDEGLLTEELIQAFKGQYVDNYIQRI